MSKRNMRSIQELFDLSGKIAIVTGGAGHLGRAMSWGLAEAGAVVVIVSRNDGKCAGLADEINAAGYKADSGQMDLMKEDSISDTIGQVGEKHGRIDILVNNGGDLAIGKDWEMFSADDWRYTFQSMMDSVHFCTKYAVPYMKDKGGSIVNIGSMYGVIAPDFSMFGNSGHDLPGNYAAVKAGVIHYTKWCASYYAKYGIRANCVSPGAFPFKREKLDYEDEGFDEFLNTVTNMTMLKRLGIPEEMKGIVVYFASDASAYCTAQHIVIDGGRTSW